MKEKTAVCLKYPENKDAPFISAKGKGELAQKIIKIAEENKIPVTEDQVLTGILTQAEIGEMIPEKAWKAVARIFAFLVETDEKM